MGSEMCIRDRLGIYLSLVIGDAMFFYRLVVRFSTIYHVAAARRDIRGVNSGGHLLISYWVSSTCVVHPPSTVSSASCFHTLSFPLSFAP